MANERRLSSVAGPVTSYSVLAQFEATTGIHANRRGERTRYLRESIYMEQGVTLGANAFARASEKPGQIHEPHSLLLKSSLLYPQAGPSERKNLAYADPWRGWNPPQEVTTPH